MKLSAPRLHPAWPLTASVGLMGVGLALPATQSLPEPTPDQLTFFETKIRPVLANNCFRCHGKDTQMAGVRLDTRAGIIKALTPGDPAHSILIKAVRHDGPVKMPPNNPPLKPNEIADLEAWIQMGAPWPKEVVKETAAAPLWSLQPVKKPAVPKLVGVTHPVDAFVRAKLQSGKLKPAPPADRRTLIRRLSYDLTGLPPTAAEVDAFVADKTPGAYGKLVDRLLASPHYGERWARLWLDVARYADTKGYVFEEDRNYYNAYTYREWVIRAFNGDLPYDQFILQQLAADRLPGVKDGDDRRALAALGFLTVGRRFLNNPPDIIDDRIDVTMRGFQGLTVACARCHDHKFDPIPTQDYYSLYGVFASSDESTIPISERSVREPWERHNAQVAAAEAAIRNLIVGQTRRLRDLAKDPANTLTPEVKGTLQMLREEVVPDGENLRKLLTAFEPAERERLPKLQKDLQELKKNAPANPEFAMAMVDRPNPGDAYVFRRGNPGINGGPAPRRYLLAMAKSGADRPLWKEGSGRLELAKTIASRENPLTARVFVNRVWQNYFGQGLVRTPSDFGTRGDKPTHPELLDYLAASFMDKGWSIKRLHRLIVTSATYRQSSTVSAATYNADPDNRTLNRMNRRRLDLEQMRDALMLASGRLEREKVGGKSVDLWKAPFAPRRAVYGFVERQNLPGIFRTFDFASPDATSARRFQTTVPQQALFFMNSPFSVDQARAVADRAEIRSAKDDGQRVRRLYRLLFGRLPDADEQKAGVAFLSLSDPSGVTATWQYGYGAFTPGKPVSFTKLAHYTNNGYQGGEKFPDPQLSYLLINGAGGHPGRDVDHATIRRWTAPATMTLSLGGVLGHPNTQGDGIRARLVSSRSGLLGEWTAHNGQTKTELPSIAVKKGDFLDFLVDPRGSEAFDGFTWSPTLRATDGQVWNASTGFGPPPPPPLSRVALYAQALMMTNEFLFVD